MFLDRSHTEFLKSRIAIREKAGFTAIRAGRAPANFGCLCNF
jgi:hypothetical protein